MTVDDYVWLLRRYFRLACTLWLKRVEAALQEFAEELDAWLEGLFAHPTPDWRQRFEAFVAEQEAAGRIISPESRQALVAQLEQWAASVDWNAVQTGASVAPCDWPFAITVRGDVSEPHRSDAGAAETTAQPSTSNVSAAEAFFDAKLAEAGGYLERIEGILRALAQRLDGAKLREAVAVENDVETIEGLLADYHE